MESCRDIDPLVTRTVDNVATDAERGLLERHVRKCAPCSRELHAEREARQLVMDRAGMLVGHAPLELRAKCAATRAQTAAPARRSLPLLSRAGWPVALAATLVMALAGAVFYGTVVNPSKAVAAQLTLDHLKCFLLFDEPSGVAPAVVQAELKARHGIDITLPAATQVDGLVLVGGRRCLYLDGSLVHLLYRKGAAHVSLFVLPTGAKLSQTEMNVLGHSAVAFTTGGRTWVALARLPRAEMRAIAAAFGSPAS
jgi:anti-sigma factor RsiW